MTKVPLYKKRSFHIGIAIVVVVSLIILAAIPYGIGYGVKKWILANGVDETSINNVDFNPFTGILIIEDLVTERASATPLVVQELKLKFVWHKLWHKQFVLESMHARGLDLVIEQDKAGVIRVGGVDASNLMIADKTKENSETPWSFGIGLVELQDIGIRYSQNELRSALLINSLQLNNLSSLLPEQATSLKLDGMLDGAGIKFSGNIRPFSNTFHIDGHLKVKALELDPYQYLLPEAIQQLKGKVTIDSSIAIQYPPGSHDSGQESRMTLAGDIFLNNVSLSLGLVEMIQGQFSWAGQSTFITKGKGTQVIMNGRLISQQLDLIDKNRDLQLQYNQLAWAGDLNTRIGSDSLSSNITGQLDLKGFNAVSGNEQYPLLSFSQLMIDEMDVRYPDNWSAGKVSLDTVVLGHHEPDKGFTKVKELTLLKPAHSTADGLSIQSVDIMGMNQVVHRSSDGKWNFHTFMGQVNTIATAGKSEKPGAAVSEKDTMEKQALAVRIHQMSLGDKSKLLFHDELVKPEFRQEITINNGSVTKLDNRHSEQKSPVELNGVIGKRTRLNMAGSISPFADRLTLDIQGTVEGYPLPPLSSYTTGMLGYTLDSGKADMKMDYKAIKGNLVANNELNLHQVNVSRVKPGKSDKTPQSRSDVPLETGLSVLRDKNNNIKIQLPITGDINNLTIDPSDIIQQALGKAVKQAAKSYLSATLFPYGTLLSIVEIAGKKVMKINLDPILYEPGSSMIDDKQMRYLQKISKILTERPEIHIRLCGVAASSDYEYLLNQVNHDEDGKPVPIENIKTSLPDEQLIALAEQRSEALESLLVDIFKVKANRLVSCQARFDKPSIQSNPRTEISM